MSLLSVSALAEKPFFVNLGASLERDEEFSQACAEERRDGSPAPAVRSVVRAV